MKKLLLASFLLLAAPVVAVAQKSLRNKPASSPRFRSNGSDNSGVGVKGGANFVSIKGNGLDKMYSGAKGLTLFHFGAYAQIGITNRFSVQPELLYQRKGFSGSEIFRNRANTADSTGNKSTIKTSYLTVPILLVFNVIEHVSIQAGPQFSYLLNVHPAGRTIDASSSNYNSVDVGLVGGIEGKFEFLRIGVRYDYSLSDLRKAGSFPVPKTIPVVTQNAQADIKYSAFQVYLGVGL